MEQLTDVCGTRCLCVKCSCPPWAGVEGLRLLLAVAPVGWENAIQCTESACCGLQCQQQ